LLFNIGGKEEKEVEKEEGEGELVINSFLISGGGKEEKEGEKEEGTVSW
jgi:hypothetical protein